METSDTSVSLMLFNWAMDLKEAADSYANATAEFMKVSQELSEAELKSSSSGGWTARQVIHHVADSEAQSYARLRGEDETLGYNVLPIVHSLNVIMAVRASSLEIIKRLEPAQLENAGIHTESGEYTIKNWLETYIQHPAEHAAQIRSGL
jgi:uncharacterized damage-inducible protein DinB